MKRYHKLIAATFFFLSTAAFSQNYQNLSEDDFRKNPYWIEMMQDPTVNFYDVQHAFELYWENREVTRSSGWKPFKRWEYMMSSRVNADGSRPAADREWNAYFDYINKYPEQKSSSGNWVNLGPYFIPEGKGYKGLGRLNAIAFHPTNEDNIFVGAPSGGLWVTYDGGQSWETQTDILPTLGVSSILIDYTNPDIVYIGTGDRDAGDAPGLGVIKSYDGGNTWEMSNNGMGNRTVGRMIMHPEDPLTILAATNAGVYKTTDGGVNWEWKQSGNFKEIVFKVDDPGIVFGAVNGHFYRSADGGENWDHITNGLPSAARGVITVTPANPDLVYYMLTTSTEFYGLYRSLDAGMSFQEMSNSPNIMSWGCEGGSGGQAWYDLDILADPVNENVIFAGGVNCFKSDDAGISWEISSHWWGDCGVPSVHADLHVLEYNPVNNKIYAGNDGGIYWTEDGGSTWHEISDGLAIGQVYKMGQSATVKDKVMNGYQDNGTSTYMGGSTWINNIGGDGMECAVDHENALYSYGTLYYGDIFRLLNNGSSTKIAGNGVNGINESGAWVTPFLLDADDPEIMFVGYKNVWKGRNIRSGNPDFSKISSSLGGSNNSNLRVLEQSPVNTEILYAARNDKQLFRCDNVNGQNPEWVTLTTSLPDNTSINDLEAHPTDENIVYMTQGTNVYKSTDKGNSWENITLNLPDVTMNDIAFYINSIEGLYVATDISVFYKDAFMDEWLLFDNGFPASARVTEVEIYYEPDDPAGDMLRASTYGRGLWESDMYHSTPVADFTAEQEMIPPSCPVHFTDLSAGVPTSWEWEFEGGEPAISNERNPQGIIFTEPGVYDVSLTISNEFGTDTKILEDYITVSDDLMPEVDFSAGRRAICSGSAVQLIDNTAFCPVTWEWSFDPGTITFLDGTNENSQNPLVQFHDNTTYSVTLIAENSNGQAELTKENFIMSGGYQAPFYESFEDGFEAREWMIDNPDDGITWQVISPGWAPEGNNSAYMNFFDYYIFYERDDLISPPLSLEGIEEPVLNFKYAYAQRHQQYDSLIVFISTDCGESWERLYANGPDGTGIFATSEPTTEYFDPEEAADWCGEGYGAGCVTLDLADYKDMTDVMFKFQAFNKLGNNLYLDDINIPMSTGSGISLSSGDRIAIHPNPASDVIFLKFGRNDTNIRVLVKSLQGKIMGGKQITEIFENETIKLQMNELSPGAYVIQITGNNTNQSDILIIR